MGLPIAPEEEKPVEPWLTPLTSAVPDTDDPKVELLEGVPDETVPSTLEAVGLDTLPWAVESPVCLEPPANAGAARTHRIAADAASL